MFHRSVGYECRALRCAAQVLRVDALAAQSQRLAGGHLRRRSRTTLRRIAAALGLDLAVELRAHRAAEHRPRLFRRRDAEDAQGAG